MPQQSLALSIQNATAINRDIGLDRENLRVPEPHLKTARMPSISAAFYFNKDVTSIVKQLAKSQGTITVSNNTLGGDPSQGTYKLLVVSYDDGSNRVAGEGQSIKLSPSQIKSANYSGKDVTSTVENAIKTQNPFTVSNQALGGDPRQNVYKYLTVGYDDGTTRVAGEGQSIRL